MKYQKFFLFFGLLLLLSACGNKGPVRPLDTPVPAPVSAVELRQRGESLVLGWQLPEKYLDNSPLKPAPHLDIYRSTFSPADDCPDCLDQGTLQVSIDPELPAPAKQIAGRYYWSDPELQIGQGYQYKLIPRSAVGTLGQPVILRQIYRQPLAAVTQLQAVPRDQSILLTWQPLIPDPGESLIGYLVYRQLDNAPPPLLPITAKPLSEPRFEDTNLDNGVGYHYRVRGLVKREEQVVEGLASVTVTAVPGSGH